MIELANITDVRVDGTWIAIKAGSLTIEETVLHSAAGDEFHLGQGVTFLESSDGKRVTVPLDKVEAIRSKAT